MAFTTEFRHSVRLLGRSPVFTLTSIVSLALGIGAAATIFGVTDALLIAPTAGGRDAESIVDIGRANNGTAYARLARPWWSPRWISAAGR